MKYLSVFSYPEDWLGEGGDLTLLYGLGFKPCRHFMFYTHFCYLTLFIFSPITIFIVSCLPLGAHFAETSVKERTQKTHSIASFTKISPH